MIEPAHAADATRLAELHAACLPDSLLSVLGPRTVTRFYDFTMRGPHEFVLVARTPDLVAGCVLSREPASMLGRFARSYPQMFVALARATASDRALRRRLWQRLRERSDEMPQLPEITQIFTDPHRRGQGLGAQLLRSCEERLRAERVPAYTIRTHRDDNAAGIRFYQREGFAKIGETRSFGDAFVVMKKDLA